MPTRTIDRRWPGATVIVAAPGPSLTPEVAAECRGQRVVAVQDAYRLMPWADVLYGCDRRWWELHGGAPDFQGERWASHGTTSNNNVEIAAKYDIRLVAGESGNTFSRDPAVIHYGSNSGFQAVNLALLFGAFRIVLVGFDMRIVDGKRHFFGDHPKPLTNTPHYGPFVSAFERAARKMPPHVEILNATPDSALTCFPKVTLDEALADPTGRRPAQQLAAAC